jgi:2-keto-4-pentenoate hydratase/2-oxohepta-3-ene-1,7-dioic acid hydratase in catechol pathway
VGLACTGGRALWLTEAGAVDVARRSDGDFGPDPMACLARWDALREWAAGLPADAADGPRDESALGPCVPRPRQIFGVGLNYRDHAREAGLDVPKQPMIFTKFPSCLAGPRADVPLTSDRVDWEVELVVAVGRGGRRLPESRALDHVAGYCVGQDVSDRRMQFAGRPAQFSLGKSAAAFGPVGPALVPADTVGDPQGLRLVCDVGDERVQDGRTGDMIFAVAELLAFLSRWVELSPGDLVFTGTPAGVGSVRDPRRYLRPGDVLASAIDGLGQLRNRCIEGPARGD